MIADVRVRRTVPDVLKVLENAEDRQLIEHCENLLAVMFAVPLLILNGILNFFLMGFVFQNPMAGVVLDTGVFFFLTMLMVITSHLKIRERLITHAVSILYTVWFLFLILRFFDIFGPAVLTLGFIQALFAMSRNNNVMLIYTGLGSLVSGIRLWIVWGGEAFIMSNLYFSLQFVLYGLLFMTALLVLRRFLDHHKRAARLLQEALQQKDEVTSLYEEITAVEEELRVQNENLTESNNNLTRSQDWLNQLAHYDTLTGLPNRKTVMDRLRLLIQFDKERADRFYVVFIDMDHFKQINDTLGHHTGDEFVINCANRLRSATRNDDLIGRIGGDEFALLVQRPLSESDIFQYIDALRTILMTPQSISGHEVRATASFGISIYPNDGVDEVELIKCADTAMYKAKELGRNNIQFFHSQMKEEILKKLLLEKQLTAALQNEEFEIVYQPQYTMDKQSIRGVEALIRWNSADLGLVLPQEFIPIAEQTGLIIPIGQWVLENACRAYPEIVQKLGKGILLSVNISPIQMQDLKIYDTISRILAETEMPPHFLEIEITESVFISAIAGTVQQLLQLKELGVSIALDDFGTGYSSLNYLKQLPLETLKIDKSFVQDLQVGKEDSQILGDMISIAHRLQLSVVAEGVEHQQQVDYLVQHGCDYAQGYLYHEPVVIDRLQGLLPVQYGNE